MIRRTVRKAFTLVEILIVVVILGILAAIVVPQFTNATQDAQAGNLKAQLSSLNRQIELYRARNNGNVPPAATFWDVMINGDTTAGIQGGYIKSPPSNPAYNGTGDATAVAAANATGDADSGWVFTDGTATLPLLPFTLYASNFNEATGAVSATPAD